MIAKSSFVFAIVAVAFAAAVNIDKCEVCGTDAAKFQNKPPVAVNVVGCSSTPCNLNGQPIEVKFFVDREVTKVTHYKRGKYGLCYDDASHMKPANDYIYNADGTKATFPLIPGKVYVHKDILLKYSSFFTIRVRSAFSLLDQNDTPIVCYQMTVKSV